MTVNGVDVSSYQAVDFPTVGESFVFAKATEGTGYVNPNYSGQVAHARAGGLIVGHYHFGRSGNGSTQADYFLSHIELKPGDILALDWEDATMTQAERDAFMARLKVRAPGHKVVLYCNVDFWKYIDTNNGGSMDGLWIADPNNPAGHPGILHPWTFQQYSWAGGIDRNVANFASAAALRAWADPQAPVTHPPVPTPVKPAPAPTAAQLMAEVETAAKALNAAVAALAVKVG